MAIQTLSYIYLILRPFVRQPISSEGWKYLLVNADPSRNFDGEIMAFGAMSGQRIDGIIERLKSFGYIGPDNGEESDIVIADMMGGTSYVPTWLELVDVEFFDDTRPIVKAWKLKKSGVYELLNFETGVSLPTKGYECDWPPHIGKIATGTLP